MFFRLNNNTQIPNSIKNNILGTAHSLKNIVIASKRQLRITHQIKLNILTSCLALKGVALNATQLIIKPK